MGRGSRHGAPPGHVYALMVGFGLLGLAVLAAGAALFARYEPVSAPSGAHVSVVTERWDATRHRAVGPPRVRFGAEEVPAAVVDWRGAPAGLEVEAAWFTEEGMRVAVAGPGRSASLARAVPLAGAGPVPAGTYVFAAGRWEDGRMVEVLARATVEVAPG